MAVGVVAVAIATLFLPVVNPFLAQVPPEVPALVPIWLTVLLSALSAAGSTALTFLVGWLTLRKTEAYRRASRWEPMAERLWQERFSVYERYLTATSDFTDTVLVGPPEYVQQAWRDVAAKHRQLQSFGGARVVQLAIPLMRACHVVTNFVEDHSGEPLPQPLIDAHTTAMIDVATAMRVDLGVDILDKWSNHWFKRSENEALHNQWRQSVAQMFQQRDQNRSH
jgi:hypothetical protein